MTDLTHIRRTPTLAFCGVAPVESLSLRHWLIADSSDVDIITAGVGQVPVDRADAIRDGVMSFPHPVCEACKAAVREEA